MLVIEDAEEIVESIKICIFIRWPECAILSTASGKAGLKMLEAESPDLVILDLTLPDAWGMDILKEIRAFSDVPVLIVSAKADETSRVKGLEYGADDFIVKPFSHTELLARIRAVLRRAHMPELWKDEGLIKAGGLSIDMASGRAHVNGSEVLFSATEWKLLGYLARNAGKIIPAQTLAINVWGLSHVESSTIKMCIRRLRQKLGDDTQSPRIIRSYRGRGYSFELSP
jgi:two-component system, OmpR family, KDP operon response regulator KdpE